jgi:hypothetical protein
MSHLQSAFDAVCKDAKQAEGYYVCLMEETSDYGGPEEGGWWRHDTVLVAYQRFDTEEQAEAARQKVLELAAELGQQAQREHGEHCLVTMEWLDARGLDADFLPEVDGPSKFHVIMSQGLPENSYGPSHYE